MQNHSPETLVNNIPSLSEPGRIFIGKSNPNRLTDYDGKFEMSFSRAKAFAFTR